VDKLNDLLFKVFHRDFTRDNYLIFYDILRLYCLFYHIFYYLYVNVFNEHIKDILEV